MRPFSVYCTCMESDSSAALRVADHSLDLEDLLVFALVSFWAEGAAGREREADLAAMLEQAMKEEEEEEEEQNERAQRVGGRVWS